MPIYNKYIKSNNPEWICQLCISTVFPFNSIDNREILKQSYNSNMNCLCSHKITNSNLEHLPTFQVTSEINNIPHLTNIDPEANIPSKVNFNYFNTHDFHCSPDLQSSNSQKSFSILNCNIRSIHANFDNLTQMLHDLNYTFSIIGLSETWISATHNQSMNIDLPGYSFVSQPTTQRAGGVGLYINNDLLFNVRYDLSSSSAESEILWVEIESQLNKNVLCGIVYRHPNSNLESFSNKIYSIIEKVHQEKKLCILSGDFNINLLNCEKHPPTEDFINTLNSYFLEPHILKPTRITNHSTTLIDNIFFNSIDYQTVSGNLLHDLSDHLPNFLIINRLNMSSHKKKLYKRDYSNYNKEEFLNEFSTLDWPVIFHGLQNASEMTDIFYSEVSDIIDSNVPLKLLSRKETRFCSKPWITPGLKASIYNKNRLYKNFLRKRSYYSHCKFKTYRNKLNHLIKISKSNYYKEYFVTNKTNTKEIWKGIRQIITLKSELFHPKQVSEGWTRDKECKGNC